MHPDIHLRLHRLRAAGSMRGPSRIARSARTSAHNWAGRSSSWGCAWCSSRPHGPRASHEVQGGRGPLVTVLAANAVSITGNSLTLIGVPWFALQTTGSPGKAGLVAFCATLPVVVSAITGGPVIDRIGRRRVSIASDLVCALALAAIPLLDYAGALEFWMLCALMAVTGFFHAPGETARYVLIPDLAKAARTPSPGPQASSTRSRAEPGWPGRHWPASSSH